MNDSKPTGVYEADGGSDWRKDAGDEGGAINGNIIEFGLIILWDTGADDPGAADSGAKRA